MSERSKPLAASQYECVESDTLPMSELEPVVSQHVSNASKSVAIVGGGLAGMAAAAALCDAGVKVEIFEQSNRLGGRASSFEGSMERPIHRPMPACGDGVLHQLFGLLPAHGRGGLFSKA